MSEVSYRILVLGDGKNYLERVGKTSIIRTYLSRTFTTEITSCNPTVFIPPEFSKTRNNFSIKDSFCKF
jgi:GTPase SAR1 family protein